MIGIRKSRMADMFHLHSRASARSAPRSSLQQHYRRTPALLELLTFGSNQIKPLAGADPLEKSFTLRNRVTAIEAKVPGYAKRNQGGSS
jgi:hypothetical protein